MDWAPWTGPERTQRGSVPPGGRESFVLDCGVRRDQRTCSEALSEMLARDDRQVLFGSQVKVQCDVGSSRKEARQACLKVLNSEIPSDCKRVCGSRRLRGRGHKPSGSQIFECERPDPTAVSEESCRLGIFLSPEARERPVQMFWTGSFCPVRSRFCPAETRFSCIWTSGKATSRVRFWHRRAPGVSRRVTKPQFTGQFARRVG